MEDLVRQLLVELGEDPSREGLTATPRRVAKSLKFLTSGYDADVDEVINKALFTVSYSEMVIVKDIDFFSLCEHHLLPFFGKCHVAYIPRNKVIGLSKIPGSWTSSPGGCRSRSASRARSPRRSATRSTRWAWRGHGSHAPVHVDAGRREAAILRRDQLDARAFRDRDRTRTEFLELIRRRHE